MSALLDTGSLAGDFISQKLVDRYNFHCNTVPNPSIVCSGLNNNCIDLLKAVSLTVSFNNELTSKINPFSINAFILKDTPIDLIVGLSTVKKYSLFQALPSLVSERTIFLLYVRVRNLNPPCIQKNRNFIRFQKISSQSTRPFKRH